MKSRVVEGFCTSHLSHLDETQRTNCTSQEHAYRRRSVGRPMQSKVPSGVASTLDEPKLVLDEVPDAVGVMGARIETDRFYNENDF